MKLKISIKLNNAAYISEKTLNTCEISENLAEISRKIDIGYREVTVLDSNGNETGEWKISGKII